VACGGLKPDLCQGGCQAIEDGVVLANCLEVERDVVTALKLYETRRVKRANSRTHGPGCAVEESPGVRCSKCDIEARSYKPAVTSAPVDTRLRSVKGTASGDGYRAFRIAFPEELSTNRFLFLI